MPRSFLMSFCQHPSGSITPYFGCGLDGVNDTGEHLLNCAIHSGMEDNTHVHCVGDGALWIFNQSRRLFGDQGEYLIDFYHICEYLSCASKGCAVDNEQNFHIKSKEFAKENRITDVLKELKPHIEPDCVPDEKAPVRRCYRYIQNRPGQFNYRDALEKGLPIGLGEIESAHRYIIQNRLKIAGAWWKGNNAQNMIALRILRADGEWETYQENHQAA
jgi:hypothetical protein